MESIKSWGTAIYLKAYNKRFIISARHVFHNDYYPKDSAVICDKILLSRNGSNLVFKDGNVFDTSTKRSSDPSLMGPRHYGLTSRFNDFFVIGLDFDEESIEFANYIDNQGYKPISLSDIDSAWNYKRGDSIVAIGYPEFSEVFDRKLPPAQREWASDAITLPVVTFGKISATTMHNYSNSFSGEIFTYHGNSGGPIICNNKLIGIVSGFEVSTILDSHPTSKYILHNERFIKSSLICEILRGKK